MLRTKVASNQHHSSLYKNAFGRNFQPPAQYPTSDRAACQQNTATTAFATPNVQCYCPMTLPLSCPLICSDVMSWNRIRHQTTSRTDKFGEISSLLFTDIFLFFAIRSLFGWGLPVLSMADLGDYKTVKFVHLTLGYFVIFNFLPIFHQSALTFQVTSWSCKTVKLRKKCIV